jgi:hypothetical protein
MKYILFLFILVFSFNVELKAQTHKENILKFQEELNAEYLNPDKSPLPKKELKKFEGLPFFEIDENFKVEAKFVRSKNATPFQMKTTTNRLPTYETYGQAIFELNGQTFTLNIYQNYQLRETVAHKDYLFIPFTDLGNGEETYGGGRYIDLRIPKDDTIVLDFNKAYNPYCAYNPAYSCPIPPKENHLDIKVTAGVKYGKH